MRLGWVRSRTLVGDIGERVAAGYYNVELEPIMQPGFDMLAPDGRRVQVRTLRSTSYLRTTIGYMHEPYDVLFALRLNEDFEPEEALEIPRAVVDEMFGDSRVAWTNALAADPRVHRIDSRKLQGRTHR